MMFKKARFINFQGHKRTDVKFDPLVTTIVGPTDAGKSALIRALGFICLNKPAGDAYTRHGQQYAKVILWTDKHKIVRCKGKGVNTYQLDGKTYHSFGHGVVPEDILKALRVSPTSFQRQLDAHFWFSESAGQVSRNLNQIVDLGVIDSTHANVAAELRRVSAKLDVTEERVKEARFQIKELAWVPSFVQHCRELEALLVKAEKAQEECRSFAILLQGVAKHDQTQKNLAWAVTTGNAAVVAGRRASHTASRASTLRNLIKQTRSLTALAKSPVPDFDPLVRERRRADGIAERRRRLEILIKEVDDWSYHIWQQQRLLRDAETFLQKQMKERCPTCGQIIKSSALPLATSTSPTDHQCSAPKRKIGIRHRRDI